MSSTMYPRRWGILQIINMGTLISTLDVGIVNVILPNMAQQYDITLAQIQWVATAYLLTMVALLPFLGKISDKWDRRHIYSFGFLIFSVGSMCIALSDSFSGLLISRCLQGVGATMIMANSQALVRQVFPDHERGRALGMNAIVVAAGTMGGPALGGILLEWVSWPWLFWINVPIGLVAFVLGLRWFPRAKSKGVATSFDLLGSFLLAGSLCLLMLAAEGSKEHGFTMSIVAEATGGVLALIVLIWYERRLPDGILDHELFRNRTVFIGNMSSFLMNLAQTATLIPIAFYLQSVLGFSAWKTGILMILQPLMMGIVAPYAGRIRDLYGAHFLIKSGAALGAVSMLVVVCFPSLSQLAIGLQLALFGIGMGLFHATMNAEIMSAAPETKLSLAGSLLAMVRYMGQIAGIGLATLMVGHMGVDGGDSGEISLLMRILFGISCISCLVVVGMVRTLSLNKPSSIESLTQSK
ncbi:MFS transporter [Paenibacillus marchantiophytorum]|uniref:MFS transporter n=1 Tax=Paenibacillus marchantiophytorum TaxID=1619310 RepID=A0ABQ1F4M7_9BACL|nr:MFS transporter [Paenibacillus marchantiophytorum]GFZ98543.1 MFS transporter [Paenibacillus marchantiophytorum]